MEWVYDGEKTFNSHHVSVIFDEILAKTGLIWDICRFLSQFLTILPLNQGVIDIYWFSIDGWLA